MHKIQWLNLIMGILIVVSFIFTAGASYDGGLFSWIFMGCWILITGVKYYFEEVL